MTSSFQVTDSHPSLLWVTIPSVLLISAYFANRWYKGYKLKKYGIGKGAPGFQTNVRQIRVTPEIAERLKRGEKVSPEEIAAAVTRAEEESKKRPPPQGVIEVGFGPQSRQEAPPPPEEESVNEWLPENITKPKKRAKGKRK